MLIGVAIHFVLYNVEIAPRNTVLALNLAHEHVKIDLTMKDSKEGIKEGTLTFSILSLAILASGRTNTKTILYNSERNFCFFLKIKNLSHSDDT